MEQKSQNSYKYGNSERKDNKKQKYRLLSGSGDIKVSGVEKCKTIFVASEEAKVNNSSNSDLIKLPNKYIRKFHRKLAKSTLSATDNYSIEPERSTVGAYKSFSSPNISKDHSKVHFVQNLNTYPTVKDILLKSNESSCSSDEDFLTAKTRRSSSCSSDTSSHKTEVPTNVKRPIETNVVKESKKPKELKSQGHGGIYENCSFDIMNDIMKESKLNQNLHRKVEKFFLKLIDSLNSQVECSKEHVKKSDCSKSKDLKEPKDQTGSNSPNADMNFFHPTLLEMAKLCLMFVQKNIKIIGKVYGLSVEVERLMKICNEIRAIQTCKNQRRPPTPVPTPAKPTTPPPTPPQPPTPWQSSPWMPIVQYPQPFPSFYSVPYSNQYGTMFNPPCPYSSQMFPGPKPNTNQQQPNVADQNNPARSKHASSYCQYHSQVHNFL